jgi:cyclopropane fatty-acyl-phospholipid synthase-like methyltransferase
MKKVEDKDYKGFIGNPTQYDNIGKIVFELIKKLGLQKNHKFLDIGCGSLRVGKHLIKYLDKNKYYGLEPNQWLIDEAIEKELTHKYVLDRGALFSNNGNFFLKCFGEKFNFILANSIFIHADKNQIEECFKQVNEVLEEGGYFLYNFIVGKKDNDEEGWTYPSHIKYTLEYFTKIMEKYHLAYYVLENCDYPGEQIFILVRKKCLRKE